MPEPDSRPEALFARLGQLQRKNPQRFAEKIQPILESLGPEFVSAYAPYAERAQLRAEGDIERAAIPSIDARAESWYAEELARAQVEDARNLAQGNLPENLAAGVPPLSQVRHAFRTQAGLPGVLPQRGIIGSAADQFRIASALALESATQFALGRELLPDFGATAEAVEASQADYADPTLPEKIAGGVGGAAPFVAQQLLLAKGGRAAVSQGMPALSPRWSPATVNAGVQAATAGALSFKGEVDENPNDLAGAFRRSGIEAAATFIGGRSGVEALRGMGESIPRALISEGVEEGATGLLQAADQIYISDRRPLSDMSALKQVAEEGVVSAAAGSLMVPLFRPGDTARAFAGAADHIRIRPRSTTEPPEIREQKVAELLAARDQGLIGDTLAEGQHPPAVQAQVDAQLARQQASEAAWQARLARSGLATEKDLTPVLETAEIEAVPDITPEVIEAPAAPAPAPAPVPVEAAPAPAPAAPAAAPVEATPAAATPAPALPARAEKVRSRLDRELAEGRQLLVRLDDGTEAAVYAVDEDEPGSFFARVDGEDLSIPGENIAAILGSARDGADVRGPDVAPEAAPATVETRPGDSRPETGLPAGPGKPLTQPSVPSSPGDVAATSTLGRSQRQEEPGPSKPKPVAPGGLTYHEQAARVEALPGQIPPTVVNLEPVGNAHAVAETAQGDFVVVGTHRKAALRNMKGGRALVLHPIESSLKRARRRDEKFPGGAPGEVLRFKTREEAERAARAADAALGEREPIVGGMRKRAAGEAVKGEEAPADTARADRIMDRIIRAKPSEAEKTRLVGIMADAARAEEKGDTETRDRLFAQVEAALPALTREQATIEREEAAAERAAEAEQQTPADAFRAAVNPVLAEPGGRSTSDVRTVLVDAAAQQGVARETAEEIFDAVVARARARGQVSWPLVYRQAGGALAGLIQQGNRPQAALWMQSGPGALADAAWDGLSIKQRMQTVEDMAGAFGLKLVMTKAPLRAGRRIVPTVYDPASQTVFMTPPTSVQQAARWLIHEATHDEILKLSETERGQLYGTVLGQVTDLDAVVSNVRKRWGSALPKVEKGQFDAAALDEALADGAAEALLTDQGELIGRLPPKLGRRLTSIFRRLGETLRKIVRRLPGLRGLRKGEQKEARNALVELSRNLMGRRLDRLREQARAVDQNIFDQAGFVRAVGREAGRQEAERADIAEAQKGSASGDMHAGFLEAVSRIPGTGRGFASNVHRASVKAWGDLLNLTRNFPIAGFVTRGLETADRTWRRDLFRMDAGFRPLLELPSAKAEAYAELLYALRRQNRDTAFKSYEAGLDWLRDAARRKGLDSDKAVEIARAVHETTFGVRQERLEALAQFLGLSRSFSSKETDDLIKQWRELMPEEQDPADLDRLEAWKTIVERSEDNADPFYIPYVRLPNDVVLLKYGDDGKVVHRENLTQRQAKKRAAELGGNTEIIPRSSFEQRERTEDPAKLIEKLQGIAARLPGVEPGDAAQFLDRLLPALLADSPAARELEARGTPGYEADPVKALAYWGGTLAQSIRALNTSTKTRDAMKVLAQDKQRPELYRFLRELAYNSGLDDAKDFRGVSANLRLAMSARTMWAPVQGLMNTINSFTMMPFMLAHLAPGKSPKALAETYLALLGTTWDVYGKGILTAREAIPTLLGKSGPDSWFYRQLAKRLPADESAALMRAVKESGALGDPEGSRLQRFAAPESARMATALNRGVMAGQTATDRAARAAAFLAAYRTASTFSDTNWNRVKERGYTDAQDPYSYAVWATQHAMGDYSRRFRPEWGRNPIGAMAYQFTTWAKRMTHQVHNMTVDAAREAKKGNLEALGLLVGMAGLGTLIHGFALGIPIYGPILKTIADALLGAIDDEDLDELAMRKIAEAEKEGDNSAAFLHRMWAYGAVEAAAQTDVPGVRQAGQLLAPATTRAAPGMLLYGIMMNPRFGPSAFYSDVLEGGADIREGTKNDNGEAVARGVTRIMGSPVSRASQIGALLDGRGLLRPVPRATGQYASTMIPSEELSPADKLTAAANLLMGAEPVQSANQRRLNRMLQAAETESVGAMQTRVFTLAQALRSRDPKATESASNDLAAYIQEQTTKLDKAEGIKQARILAGLSWLRQGSLQGRLREAYLQLEYGDVLPDKGASAWYHQSLLQAAQLGQDFDEDEEGEEDE